MGNVGAWGSSVDSTAAVSDMFFKSGTTSQKSACIVEDLATMQKCEMAARKRE